jgi:hypothetical protein
MQLGGGPVWNKLVTVGSWKKICWFLVANDGG